MLDSDVLLRQADQQCQERGVRFTPIRRRVLEMISGTPGGLKAYDLLDRLSDEHASARPPTVYRALDFLVGHGFAHKIERLNAFIACVHPSHSHTPAFMICRLCDAVAEAQSSPARGALGDAARATGFRIERTVVEASGVCPACIDKADA